MKLGSLLHGTALRLGDREAVVCGDRRLTFEALDERSNRLANALLDRGFRSGSRIAVHVSNSLEFVEVAAGILKMGAVLVPISTRLAPSEVQYILKDAGPAGYFFSPDARAEAHWAASGLDIPLKVVTEGGCSRGEITLAALIDEGTEQQLPLLPQDLDDCLISYTSGTTGRPKGVISTHSNVVIFSGYINAIEYGLSKDDVILVTTPIAHRTGLGRIGNLFASGCKVVIMRRFDPKEAVDIIAREGVTVLGCVPTIVRLLMPEIERRPEALNSLRLIAATGEVFPAPLKTQLFEALPNVSLYTYFASTEAGTVCALLPHEQQERPTSMGRPLPGVEVRVVDQDLNDLPDGTAGEMLVRCGSPGAFTVMRAYYNQPQATEEAFFDGWLRTGDIVLRDMDGFLYFVDRAKDMVVSGGLNIYSKEVEVALLENPAIADAAVVGVPDPRFGEAVVAFIETKAGVTLTSEEVIQECRSHIAGYKKPKYIKFLDQLPRTSTGKVLKGELRKIAVQEFSLDDAGTNSGGRMPLSSSSRR